MRLLRPSIAVFVLALLASLCIHFPIYEALGELAHRLLSSPPEQHATVEFELAPLGKGDTPEPEALQKLPDKQPVDDPKQPQAKAKPPEKAKPQAPTPPKPELKPKAEPTPIVPQVAQVQPAPAPPPPEQPKDSPLAVRQKSDDPNVPPPEHPQFIAEENRRVEEETVARIRNMQRDDEHPTPANAPSKSADDQPGDAEKTEVEDLQKVKGSDERPPNEREATQKPQRASQDSAGRREAEAVAPAPAVPRSPSKAVDAQRASGTPDTGGTPDTIVVSDGAGTFTIRKQPQGRGPGNTGGAQKPGQPTDSRNDRNGARAQNGVNLRLSWSAFEHTYGADELEAQRAAYLEQRKSSVAGHSNQRAWKEFRAAIENFVPNVKPGTQTALNAAADPFAAYLAAIHDRIHRTFAFGFLRGLPLVGGPYDDQNLHTELEIVINGDGSVHKVGVAESSGFLPFDYGAFNAVMRASPYPQPPRKILSGDGRVYVHWGFYRNPRQCGTFNARPYILPNVHDTSPDMPVPRAGPHDEPSAPSGPADSNTGEFGALPPPSPRVERYASL